MVNEPYSFMVVSVKGTFIKWTRFKSTHRYRLRLLLNSNDMKGIGKATLLTVEDDVFMTEVNGPSTLIF